MRLNYQELAYIVETLEDEAKRRQEIREKLLQEYLGAKEQLEKQARDEVLSNEKYDELYAKNVKPLREKYKAASSDSIMADDIFSRFITEEIEL